MTPNQHRYFSRYLSGAVSSLVLYVLGGLLATPGIAQEQARSEESAAKVQSLDYVVGMLISHGPEHPGALIDKSHFKPMLAFRLGRWRISNSGAGQVLGFGEDVQGPGASTELLRTDALRMGLALRLDKGRISSDSIGLRGLPDVDATLRGRLFVGYHLNPQWKLHGAYSQDLLGRGGGGLFDAGTSYTWRLGRRTEWSLDGGLTAGSSRYMQSYFGVSQDGSMRTGLAEYEPGASLRDAYVGLGFTHALTSRWILFSSIGRSRLLSDAALSPFVKTRDGNSMGIGLAYRCCRWEE